MDRMGNNFAPENWWAIWAYFQGRALIMMGLEEDPAIRLGARRFFQGVFAVKLREGRCPHALAPLKKDRGVLLCKTLKVINF